MNTKKNKLVPFYFKFKEKIYNQVRNLNFFFFRKRRELNFLEKTFVPPKTIVFLLFLFCFALEPFYEILIIYLFDNDPKITEVKRIKNSVLILLHLVGFTISIILSYGCRNKSFLFVYAQSIWEFIVFFLNEFLTKSHIVSGEGDLYRFLLYLFSFFSTLMIYYLVFPEFFFFMKTYLFKNNSFIIRFIFICLIFYVFQGIIFKLLKKNPSQKTIVSDFILSKNDNKLNEEFKKNPIATFFIVVIVAPVIEELSFRAGIMGFFNTKSKKEKIVASIISIIVFSSAHYLHYVKNVDEFFGKKFWGEVFAYSVMSFVFVILFFTSHQNIWFTSSLHFVNNFISTLYKFL